jgi:hypothetical protein
LQNRTRWCLDLLNLLRATIIDIVSILRKTPSLPTTFAEGEIEEETKQMVVSMQLEDTPTLHFVVVDWPMRLAKQVDLRPSRRSFLPQTISVSFLLSSVASTRIFVLSNEVKQFSYCCPSSQVPYTSTNHHPIH